MELIEYKEMREAIQRVRELHKPIGNMCRGCFQNYPCQTLNALDDIESVSPPNSSMRDYSMPNASLGRFFRSLDGEQ